MGGFEDSPNKLYRVYGRVYGAYGQSFLARTDKTVRISIVSNDKNETLLLRKEYQVHGGDVGWSSIWNATGDLSLAIFEKGPSNLLVRAVFHFDSTKKTFTELP